MLNDNGQGQGPGSGNYHTVSSVKGGDWTNKPIARSFGDTAQARIALADCWRAYEAHRATTGAIHNSADSTNTLSALPPLLALDRAFLSEIQKASPTAPATANAGVTVLVHGAGFTEG
jgi:hypothetical protein